MIVEVAIPELRKYSRSSPRHWLNTLFLGNVPQDYATNALATTYVRLVDAANEHYKLGRIGVIIYWSDHSSAAIDEINLATTYFEDCVNSMHRAILCMKGIRGRRAPADLKSLFPQKPNFTAEAVAGRIRDVRDTIQHMDERVIRREISKGTPFALMATRPETPVPNQAGQILKVIDRLVIGNNELLFSDLVAWLHEMGNCAEAISKYER
jgi:hypothetical protein